MVEIQLLTKKERRELRRQEKDLARGLLGKRKTFKRLVMWVVVVLVLAGSAYGVYKYGNSLESVILPVDGIGSTNHVFGLSTSGVVLIEYGDFQCPACGQYEPIVKKVREDYKDKIAFVYRHFPLSQHKNAKITAHASEVAAKQNKFWELHDIIFENQNEWSNLSDGKAREVLIKYAGGIGLDVNLFKDQIDSSEIKNKVQADSDSGLKAGVNSTPTFILNGKKIQPRSYDEFKQLIEKELSQGS